MPIQHKTQAEFSSDLPYPPIQVTGRNAVYANAMLDNLGGINSEMTSINTYFYTSLITEQKISQSLHTIMMMEMHHLSIFGKLAMLLGQDPRFWTQNGRQRIYWTPEYTHYPANLKDLFSHALQGEYSTIEKYQCQIGYIKDPYIAEILSRIIADEKLHVEILEKLYREYCGRMY